MNFDKIEYFTIADFKNPTSVQIKKTAHFEASLEVVRTLKPNSGFELQEFSCELIPESEDGSNLWFQKSL